MSEEDLGCYITRGATLFIEELYLSDSARESQVGDTHLQIVIIQYQNVVRFYVSVQNPFFMHQVHS